jgi:hypothetical protein
MRMKLFRWIACATLLTAGCRLLDPDYQGITVAGDSIHLVADTEAIRGLLAVEEKRDEGLTVTDKPPARKDFLEAMARAPGIIVPEKTYCRILTTSKVHCASQFSTQVYLKVPITTGPYRGSEGWGCEGSDIAYANAFP